MKWFKLSEIAYITNSILIGKDLYVKNISIDTRNNKIINSLFIVLKWDKNINFLCFKAINNGALALLVENYISFKISQLLVKSTRLALGKISKWLRKKSCIFMLSLTGSTGKTSVKEITYSILSQYGKTLCNYKNFNNNLGVPITLLNLQYDYYKYAIIELGGSSINDISYLSKIVLPDVSCITNISISHLNGYKNLFNIIISKGKIFKYLKKFGIAIINNNQYYNFWNKYLLFKKILFFSFYKKKNSLVYIEKLKINMLNSIFILCTKYGKIKIYFNLLGIHNIINAVIASCLFLSISKDLRYIKYGLENCLPIKGRLYPIIINKNKFILDDTYNSNPRSLYYSLLHLNKCIGYKVLVISDMLELNNMSLYYHIKIGFLIRNKLNINIVLSIGFYSYYISKYSLIGIHFNDFNKLLLYIKKIFFSYNCLTVLIKGSRLFNMNKIIDLL